MHHRLCDAFKGEEDEGNALWSDSSFLLSSPPSLSQYSEDNMMDPYNLAICFGPTLMSVPEGHDQVSCQAHVNELIKTIIIHHDGIFPGLQELPGPIYTVPGTGEDFW